jgi:predicted nucleotidyltransferase
MSTIVPILSTNRGDKLADALFPKARQAVLGLLFEHPDESFYLREIADATGLGLGHIQRELNRLSSAGVIVRTPRGRQVHFQADPDCPLFDELRGIARKTIGVAPALRRALEPLHERIRVAFVFGSVARGEERQQSDVDLMIVGDATFAEVVVAVKGTEDTVRRNINPVVYATSDFASKLAARNHFLTKVLEREKLFLIGDEDELATISRE